MNSSHLFNSRNIDHNLRFAILSTLCRQGVYSYVNKEKYYNDTADENYEAYQPIIEHWLKQSIDPYLDQITELTWGPDDDMIFTIWTYWDGEDDYFDIVSLAGIEKLKNLKSLRIDWLLADTKQNRQIITQLQGHGVTVHINGQVGWSSKKASPSLKALPSLLKLQPAPSSELFFPSTKKYITIVATSIEALQAKLDANISAVFDLRDLQTIQKEESTSVGGFTRVIETQAIQAQANYHSMATTVYWNEQEIANVSFYARYILGTQCLTITSSARNINQLTKLTVEADNIDPSSFQMVIEAIC